MTQETPIHGETSADHSDGTSAETTSIQYREKNRLRKKKSLIRRYQYLLKLKRLGKIETQLGVIYKQLEEEKTRFDADMTDKIQRIDAILDNTQDLT